MKPLPDATRGKERPALRHVGIHPNIGTANHEPTSTRTVPKDLHTLRGKPQAK